MAMRTEASETSKHGGASGAFCAEEAQQVFPERPMAADGFIVLADVDADALAWSFDFHHIPALLQWRQSGEDRAEPDAEETDDVAANYIGRRGHEVAILDQHQSLPGIAAEGGVSTQESRSEKQSPQWTDADAFADERQHDANRKCARDIDQQRAVRKVGAEAIGCPVAHHKPQVGAEHRADGNRHVLHIVK